MGKLGALLKVSLAATVLPTAGFVGYRKREIWEIERSKREEVRRLDTELDDLVPAYAKQIAAQQQALEEAKEAERLKVTLWEDRLRRFKEETDDFLQYVTVIPAQLQELEEINKMYFLVSKVVQDSRPDELKFEATCRKIHQALYAGHDALLRPDAVVAKAPLQAALQGAARADPDPLLDRLAAAAQSVEDTSPEARQRIEAQFREGLTLIEETQFSVSGPDQHDFAARIFGKAQQALRFEPSRLSPPALTAEAPRQFVSEREVQQGLEFAQRFLRDAKEGRALVAATRVPINSTPEGADAMQFMEDWVVQAQAYVGMRQLTAAFHAHLLGQAIRLGLPEVAAREGAAP